MTIEHGQVDVVDTTPELRPVLANLLELYQYDFTEFDAEDVGDDGRFGADFLDRYFAADPDRYALLLRVDGRWAGLALLRRGAFLVDDPEMMDVVEFFVMRKYRRQGVGAEFARRLFARFPGRWEVRIMHTNLPAQRFWRRTIAGVATTPYDERPCNDERWCGP